MNKDLYILLFEKLLDKDLLRIACNGRKMYEIFRSEVLWRRRFVLAFPLTEEEATKFLRKIEFDSWKEFYKWIKYSFVSITGNSRYRYSIKQNFFSQRFDNSIKSNINIDIDFSIMFDPSKTRLPDFVNRELFVKEFKRYVYSSATNKITEKIGCGYDRFYDDIISKYFFNAADALHQSYT